ncbi:MAG: hypothetical protein CM15mV7_0840 [uncultured marine virus]|nr:MAG: hypothetical protein CM15mV7_0840 [uncultured marine virus]
MANDYVFFDPRKKAQQQAEDEKKLSEKEEERLRNQEKERKQLNIADFTVKPFVLMLVWNMTLPTFGIATIGYFGAVGLYVIARILFKHD